MASVALDPDVFRSASDRAMVANLTAPFAGGARCSEVAIAGDASAAVDWSSREPLLLAAPRRRLGEESFDLSGTTGGGAIALAALRFAPYTEEGAALPLFKPAVDTHTRQAPAFSVALTATRVAADGTRTALAASEVASAFELRLLEGIFGRLMYVAGAEKQRIRRQARAIQAARLLSSAGVDSLDRIGADLAVPRFLDELSFDATSQQVVTVRSAQPEADKDYRRRLGLYRPFFKPTLAAVEELLNGPGAPNEPNKGPISEIAPLTSRFSVTDAYAPLAVAIHLVSGGDDALRVAWLEYVRATMLLWPADDVTANDVHGARFLPAVEKGRVEKARTTMRAGYTFTADAANNPALATPLAEALNRVARCRSALGAPERWQISRAQLSNGGSRYELGLGVNLMLPAAAQFEALYAGLSNPARVPAADAEVESLLRSMTPEPATTDPDGRWLLGPCGLRTVQRLDATTLYLSHLPIFGLLIDGSSQVAVSGWTALVSGHFGGAFEGIGGQYESDLFAYQQATGRGELFAAAYGGLLPREAPITGLPTTWSAIVSGYFSGQLEGDAIACYDASAGTLECRAPQGSSLPQVGSPQTGLSHTIGQLVAGQFGVPGFTNLLTYDPVTGLCQFYDGNFAAMRTIGTPQDAGRGYTHVVAGSYGPFETNTLFFYDGVAGRAAQYALEDAGRLRLLAEHNDLQPGWSHVVAGLFSAEPGELLFYNRDEGTAELRRADADGGLELISSGELPAEWTHLVPSASWQPGDSGALFLYNATTAQVEMALLDRKLGLEQVGEASGPTPTTVELEGHYYAAESQSSNVVLEEGLSAVLAAWHAHGGEPPSRLSTAEASAAWGRAASSNLARQTLQDAGLPNVSEPVELAQQLPHYAPDLLATLQLGPTLAARVIAGQGADEVRSLVALLSENDIPSAVGFATNDGHVLLVVAVIGLPVAGLNLSERTATGFRWYTVPLVGPRPLLRAAGSRASLTAAAAGLSAAVMIGYARQGGVPDPYQFTVDLPAAAALSLEQYEFLMNTLEHAYPAGVSVNTYAIRRNHVALDGTVTPLPAGLSRTFRAFRRRRSRGVLDTSLASGAPAAPSGAPWTNLGGEVFGGIALARDNAGQLELFTRGRDGSLVRIHQVAPGAAGWSAWEALGGSATGSVAAALNGAGLIELFARTRESVIHSTQGAGGGFGAWSTTPAPAGELLAVGRDASGTLILFVDAADHSVSLASQNPDGSFGAWTPTNGSAAGSLIVAVNANGRLELLACGLDQTLWHNQQTGAPGPWSGWSSLGGTIRDAFAVAANADGRLQAFACGLDGTLATIAQTSAGGSWGAWSSLGGTLGNAVAAAANADGRLQVFATAADESVATISQTAPGGSWTTWTSLGGSVSDYLNAASGSDGRIEVFARGWENELWHLRQQAPNGGWSG